MKRTNLISLALTSLAFSAAHASPAPKYRATEIAVPSDSCLPGYAISVVGGGVSDHGVVPGSLNCYAYTDFGDGASLPAWGAGYAFVWNRTGGVTEVVSPTGFRPTLFNIDAGGTVYGWMGSPSGNGIDGVKWTPSAGFETVITQSPDCFLNISFAVAGNSAGNVLGEAFRPTSDVPDPFSCAFRWVFRDAFGNEIVGPLENQTPTRLNNHNVAVGQVNRSATKWLPLENNQLVTLDQASPGFMSRAFGINNHDVVVGVSGVDTSSVQQCYSDAVAMVWGPDNMGRTLPSLKRMTNSEAWAIDDDGTVYGLSSMGADFCAKRSWEANRGTIWRDFRAIDLNKQLVASPGITITKAEHVNSKGQILAYGYRTRDPLKDCPDIGTSPEDGSVYLIPGKCRDQRLYLLTPMKPGAVFH